MVVCYDLMRLYDHCDEYLLVEDTSEVHEESVPLPSIDDCGLIFLCGPYDLCVTNFLLA